MSGALFSAATGMDAQQHKLDTISNNLANVDTTGFKKTRDEFADLMYKYMKGTGAPENTEAGKTQVYTGLGVQVANNTKLFTQGSLQETGRELDVAIKGPGFFGVQQPDGDVLYTRAGDLHYDASTGTLLTSMGYPIMNGAVPLDVPQSTIQDISIQPNGMVLVNDNQVGQIGMYNCVNPEGLRSMGENLYDDTALSGAMEVFEPMGGPDGTVLLQGYLEKSNVNAVREMVDMISAQRAYEFNSKAITTADNMMQTINALKR